MTSWFVSEHCIDRLDSDAGFKADLDDYDSLYAPLTARTARSA
jgi:hypothetical protein